MSDNQRGNPYQGLIPYDEDDAPFFFGRERETRLITANLFAAPLTVLYGASGVGKSSVLRAGVVHKTRSRSDLLVVFFNSWQNDPVKGIKAAVAEATAAVNGEGAPPPDSALLAEYLAECASQLGRRLMIVLDQFEDYFLYHPKDVGFSGEFAKALSQARASFLVSIREDSVAKLDRFEGRIPILFDNLLRIEHLDRAAAREAIEKPIEEYNRIDAAREQEFSIEPELVDAVLDQVETGQVILGEAGRGVVGTDDSLGTAEALIETPYLQLVMTRLWDEEIGVDSDVLRLETLNRLGGAERIVRTHLDGVMNALLPSDQEAAARIFYHLVTPGGTKITYPVLDLVGYAGLDETQLTSVLEQLSRGDSRILRQVGPASGQPAEPRYERYEIFHDVLAPAILGWRTRYVHQLAIAQERKRQRIWMLLLGVLLLFPVVSYRAYSLWLENRPWGTMRNLSTGTVHALKGDSVSIGRSTEFQNTINLRPGVVSRFHLLVSKNLSAFDWRTLNGTTVNAEFLPYGSNIKLEDEDIIVLAGIAPFKFETIEYSRFQFWTPSLQDSSAPSGWGMLIDGRARTVKYLNAAQYFLSLDEQDRIILREKGTDTTLLTIRRDDNGRISIEDRNDSVDLLATMKEGDYSYPAYKVPPGREFVSFSTGRESHDLFEVAYSYRGVSFQIVSIVANLEPPAPKRR